MRKEFIVTTLTRIAAMGCLAVSPWWVRWLSESYQFLSPGMVFFGCAFCSLAHLALLSILTNAQHRRDEVEFIETVEHVLNASVASQEVDEPMISDFAGVRVLLVEDNPVNQRVAAHTLRRFGCEVETAENGAEAVKLVQDNDFDIIFMDLEMPVMDGLQASSEIRGIEGKGSEMPIIALTAMSGEADKDACLACGMNDFLSKPFSARDLSKMIARHIAFAEAEAA
ncbi:MAG: response regulator [Armatimonadetes bacterium]|nr:response regulator [Armatimonadota bacterium]